MCDCLMTEEERKAKALSAQIDRLLQKEKKVLSNEVKMLLLGTGEAGKSTILKQMFLIHGKGFTKEDALNYRRIIFTNVVSSMKTIMDAMSFLGISFGKPQSIQFKLYMMNLPLSIETTELDPYITEAVSSLWIDPGVQICFGRSREYQLNDSAKYLFENIERIGGKGYLPNDQDILRARQKTVGITETKFLVNDLIYRMFDVGGQRDQRKKWISCFENVTAIVFLVAISEYDQVLAEDDNMNRIRESLTVFETICKSKYFTRSSIILFLNKIDLFQNKLLKSPLSKYFPKFTGPNEYAQCADFLKDSFLEVNPNKEKPIFSHFTCATDTEQVKFVIFSVTATLIRKRLEEMEYI